MVVTLLVIVLIVVVGVSVLGVRNRSAKGIESGISSFRRELRALAPESDERPPSTRPLGDPPNTSGVGILRPPPEPDPDEDVPDPGHGDLDGTGDDDESG